MGQSLALSNFYENKRKFFSKNQNPPTPININDFTKYKNKAKNKDYFFVDQNKELIQQEVRDLFNVLEAKRHLDPAFWLYCYYCAVLLENYHDGYGQKNKVEDYKALQRKIKTLYNNEKQIDDGNVKTFIQSMKDDIITDLGGFITIPLSISKIRDKAGLANIWRIYWVFCRFMLEKGLKLTREINLIDKLDDLLGKHTDVDDIIKTFNVPSAVLNVLSVGFFAVRFLINAGLFVKHVAFPSEKERQIPLAVRLRNEWDKRGADMLNHGGWSLVNLITNYNTLFKISGPLAGWIVVGFLWVDIFTLLYKKHRAEKAFLLKRNEYDQEIAELIKEIEENKGNPVVLAKRLEVMREQKKQLEIDWHTKRETYNLMIYATFALMVGFGASMVLTPAVAVIACYFVCVLGVATYLSEGVFADYKNAQLQLKYTDRNAGNSLEIQRLEKNYIAAKEELIKTMVKYSIMPSLLILTYAICWPAALALTVLYVGFEIYQSYKKHQKSQEVLNPGLEHDSYTHLSISSRSGSIDETFSSSNSIESEDDFGERCSLLASDS